VLAVAGCAQPKRLSDGLTFRAPDGWTEMHATGDPNVELWQPADKSRRGILSLNRDLPAFDAAIVVKSLVDNHGRLLAQRRMVLCGNQPSEYSRVVQRARTGTYTWEIVTSRTPSALWEAQYMYPAGSLPDAKARAALYELCPAR